jgi:AraC family transcriptional regulator
MVQTLAEGVFFGKTIKSRSVAGLFFSESVYAPNVTLPKHMPDGAYFCFVLRGSDDEMHGRRTQICNQSSLVFHRQQDTHADRFHARGAHLLNIELGPMWIQSLREQSIVLDDALTVKSVLSTSLANRIYQEFKNNDTASAIAIEGLALELIAETVRDFLPRSIPPRRIELAKEYLEAHFSEPIGLGRLAIVVDAHPVYLAREFRRC